MKHLRMMAAAALVLAAIVQAGCTARQADNGARTTEQVAVSPGTPGGQVAGSAAKQDYSAAAPEGAPALGGSAPLNSQPLIVRNGSLQLRVNDTGTAIDGIRRAVSAAGGQISDLSVSGGEAPVYPQEPATSPSPSSASITIRVEAAKLDSLTSALSKLGTVISQSESASDVTEQAIDMEARLKNLRAEEARLRTFLDRTNKVSELLAVEAELSRVRGEIESMDAQLTYLKRQAARATLVVILTEPGPVTGSQSPWFGMREAFSRGVQAAIGLVEILVTVVIAVLPLLVLAAVIVFGILAAARRSARKRMAQSRSGHPAQERDEDSGEES